MRIRSILVTATLSGATLESFLASDEYADIRKLREGAVDWLAAMVPALPTH